jgi:DNA-binding response OmpR family regulator
MLPLRVLLISADIPLSNCINTCLSQAGFKVIHTSHGMGAMELVHKTSPILIILDVELPDYNSLSVIRALRADEQDHRTPLILFGSNLKEEDVLIGLEVGADLCLLEAFHPSYLLLVYDPCSAGPGLLCRSFELVIDGLVNHGVNLA